MVVGVCGQDRWVGQAVVEGASEVLVALVKVICERKESARVSAGSDCEHVLLGSRAR